MTHSPVVSPPTLAGFLRAARQRVRLSREALAAAAAVSSSYVTQLETGEKTRPSATALGALSSVLGFDGNERRHVFNLAQLPTPVPTPPQTGISEAMREAIEHLPCIARYADDHWNILAVNARHRAAFPGVAESGNLVRWIFGAPIAKDVMVEWDVEAADYVYLLRGLTGAQPNNAWIRGLLDELSQYPHFVRFWNDGNVAFHRRRPYMHVREPDTGELYTINAQLFTPVSSPGTAAHMYLGVRIPYMGPDVPPPRVPHETGTGKRVTLQPPTLADFLRGARKSHGLSRDQLAVAAAISSSYVAQLETGEKDRPSAIALHAVAQALELGPTEFRHVHNLAQLPPGERIEPPRTEAVVTPQMRAAIEQLPCIAVYMDDRWNVLAVNPTTEAWMPELARSGNMLRWIFRHPVARKLMIDWEYEAETAAHWFRAAIGAFPSVAHLELLRELAADRTFAAFWSEERVVFSRDRPMHLRDAGSGEPYSIFPKLYHALPDSPRLVHVFLGVRLPYRGPRPTPAQ